jgi:hypothetical protein
MRNRFVIVTLMLCGCRDNSNEAIVFPPNVDAASLEICYDRASDGMPVRISIAAGTRVFRLGERTRLDSADRTRVITETRAKILDGHHRGMVVFIPSDSLRAH